MKAKIFLIITIVVFVSCQDDSKDISQLTKYPTFIYKGGQYITLTKGETYNDPGVTTVEGYLVTKLGDRGSKYIDADHPDSIGYTNTIDTNTPGIYITTYTSTNTEEFTRYGHRYVFVFENKADPKIDLSGEYFSGSPSPNSIVTKIADGVFYSTNLWGGGSLTVIPGIFICSDGVNIQVPQQDNVEKIYGYGTLGSNGTLNLLMSRPDFPVSFGGPLIDFEKSFSKLN